MNFLEYARQYEETILSMRKPASQASVKSHIRRASREFADIEISESAAQVYVSKLAAEMSARATRNYWGSISRILARAKREGLVANVPEPELPRGFKTMQKSLTIEEMRNIIRRSPEPYSTLFAVLAETHLRVGELLGLKPEDISGQYLTVSRSLFNGKIQRPKTESSCRTISISERLSRRLEVWPEYKKQSGSLLRRLHAAGIDKQAGCHAFRRGGATALAALGCPESIIRARLGHAGGTTARYISVKLGADKIWAEKLAEILGE